MLMIEGMGNATHKCNSPLNKYLFVGSTLNSTYLSFILVEGLSIITLSKEIADELNCKYIIDKLVLKTVGLAEIVSFISW